MDSELLTAIAREGLTLLVSVAIAFSLVIALGKDRKSYLTGVLSAFASQSVLWLWSKLSFVVAGAGPPPGAFIHFLTPTVEELTRAVAVYSVLNLTARVPTSAFAFSIGFALVEVAFKVISFAATYGLEQSALPALFHVSFGPLVVLVFLGMLMCLLRVSGARPPLAFCVCVIAHIIYNVTATVLVDGDLLAPLYGIWLFCFASVVAVGFVLAGKQRGATSVTD